jgi:hypothetical protein
MDPETEEIALMTVEKEKIDKPWKKYRETRAKNKKAPKTK